MSRKPYKLKPKVCACGETRPEAFRARRRICRQCESNLANARNKADPQRPEKLKRWRDSNPGHSARYNKNRDPQKVRAANREGYRKHRERRLSKVKEWRRENPEKILQYQRERRGRHAQAAGHCTPAQWLERLEFYGHRCAYCRAPATEADHVISLNRGGSRWPANLRPSCRSCNASKGDKSLSEWLRVQVAEQARGLFGLTQGKTPN